MLLELYKTSSLKTAEYRYPILLALEVIMTTEDGVDAFLGQDGWKVVFKDLETILRSILSDPNLNNSSIMSDAARGLQIIRVLLAVIDHESTTAPREDWMSAITTAASLKVPASNSPPLILELHIAMLQLSTALLSKAAGGMQKRYVTSNAALSGLTNQLGKIVKEMNDREEAADFLGLLEDVALDLENLRFSG